MAEKRGPGRPTTYGHKRDVILRVRVTEADLAHITEQAATAGLTIAEWLYHRAVGKRIPKRS